MIAARLYQQPANAGLYGPAPRTADAFRSIDDLARAGGRPAPIGSRPHLYYGRVMLDPARVGRDAGLVSGEVIFPLAQLMGSMLTVTLDIGAEVPDGIPERLVRVLTENGHRLKFTTQGFVRD